MKTTLLMKLRDLSVKTKLVLLIGFFAVSMILGGILGLYGMSDTLSDFGSVYKQRLAASGKIAHIMKLVQENRGLVMDAAHATNPTVTRMNGEKMERNREEITKVWEDYSSSSGLTKEERRLAGQWKEDRTRYVKDGLNTTMALLNAGKYEAALKNANEIMDPAYIKTKEGADMLIAYQAEQGGREYEESAVHFSIIRAVAITGIAFGIVVACIMGLIIMRAIANPLRDIIGHFGRIADGHYNNKIDTGRNDEPGKVLQALDTMQTRLSHDVSEARRVADESLRIKNALDHASTSVMVTDVNGSVIYTNAALTGMFEKTAIEVCKSLPGFSIANLATMNVDVFCLGDVPLREKLKALTATLDTTIKLGGCTFRIAANPVVNGAGERLGICIEWLDITAELKVQEEIRQTVQAAKRGDLERRISVKGKEGFIKMLSLELNELLSSFYESIQNIADAMNAIAKGDLTVRVDRDYEGVYLDLKNDINATVQKLTDVISNIKESADFIRTASMEISMGNTNLSQRTQEQASALEETASSMEQMASTVTQNADNARQANQMVNSARDEAQKSGEIVTNAVGAMDAIATSSKKISDIIGVIDEIAFQTNLLALNAAVEAARAGEQGRGFAVVATEVRNLAQRSATAAKEIKGLINDSVENVENGNKQVDATGEVLAEISGSVKKISDIVGEIAAASREQASGIEQVNKAVMQMDEMTQQNAALVEEAAAASKSMEEQAVQLFEQVTFFRLTESEKVTQNQPQKMAKVSVVPPSTTSAVQPSKKAAPVLKTVASRLSAAKVKGGTNDVEWDEF